MSVTGLCQCGCGAATRVATHTDRSKGWVKGEPLKFVFGHALSKAWEVRSAQTRGNRRLSTHGYVLVAVGKGRRRYEHHLVAEKVLGRPLRSYGPGHPDTEVVHHIDGNKTNNSPSNLLICTHSYHTELHHRLEQSPAWPEFQPVVRNQGKRHV